MDTKALKKQMGAAIAMVLVAAVALGSATFAWFVTNNTVKGTTSEISAQSNAAFMKIKYNDSAKSSDLTVDKATLTSKALYPAQWSNNFSTVGGTDKTEGTGVYQFETGYGTNPTANGYTMDSTTLKAIGAPASAVSADYAVANVFNISSKGTDLENLKVKGATIATTGEGQSASANSELNSALRVLVCTVDDSDTVTNWVLCSSTGVISDSKNHTSDDLGKFGDGVTVKADEDTKVIMYVYYDGNDSKIYSNNLPSLQDASSRITVTFTADAQNK